MTTKPIEVGCLAVIVDSLFTENIGKTVRVIDHDPGDPSGLEWKIRGDHLTTTNGLIGRRILCEAWSLDRWLMRIDDPDVGAENESEASREDNRVRETSGDPTSSPW